MDIGARPAAAASAGNAPAASDLSLSIQQRLRQLGATYYLLEPWGGQQQLYRFCCKIAVGGDPNCTRYFEAIEADPLRAMSKVLAQIEPSQAGKM
jgi:hypothetical protein